MRITDRMVVEQNLSYIQRGRNRLGEAQKRVATGRGLHRSSDSPADVERAMTIARELRMSDNQVSNLQVTREWMNSTEEAMGRFNDILVSAKTLAARGRTDSLGVDERLAISTELGALLEDALSVANSKSGSNFLFSGHQIKTEPFAIQNDTVIYRGDNASIRHPVELGQTMPINVTGVEGETGGLFYAINEMNNLANAMGEGDMEGVDAFLSNVDIAMRDTSASLSTTGARIRRVDRTEERITERQTNLRSLYSDLVDADMASTIAEMSAENQAYEMTLATASRVMPRSLLDFLR